MADARRRLSAILAADVVGYSRLVGLDEAGTVARVRALFREVAQPEVARAGGRVFKAVGDGFLAEFPSAVAAVTCAAAIQAATEARAAAEPEDRRIRARIGVHLGDVLVEGTDLFGDGVNVAARLEGLAEPGGVVLSAPVADAVRGRISEALEDLGERALKNIARPIRVFRLAPAATPAEPRRLAVPERPSLVVLPFQNLSGDPEQEYFADGMVEDITTALSRIRWLFVIARNSAFTYKGRAVDVRQVGRDLGVRYVLEGSVRRAGNRVRITGQLIEAETGRHVWADRFDGDLSDIFELQDRVTEAIAGAIEPSLRRAEIARATAKPTHNLDAYDLYLRAIAAYYPLTRAGIEASIQLLRSALALDPNYALAQGSLAWMLAASRALGWGDPSSKTDAALAVELARHLIASGTDDALALRGAAHALSFFARDYAAALAALERAARLQPNSSEVESSLGWVHCHAGRGAAAVPHFERYMRLNPLDPERAMHITGLGIAYLLADENERGRDTLRRAVDEAPQRVASHRSLVLAYVRLGQIEEARKVVRRLLAMHPNVRATPTGYGFAKPGYNEELVEALKAAGLPT